MASKERVIELADMVMNGLTGWDSLDARIDRTLDEIEEINRMEDALESLRSSVEQAEAPEPNQLGSALAAMYAIAERNRTIAEDVYRRLA